MHVIEWNTEFESRLGGDLRASIDRFLPYADQHFAGRLRAFLATAPHTKDASERWQDLCRCLWEMHVGLACLERGLKLVPSSGRDVANGGPDLLIIHGARRTWIECIVPADGDENNKVIRMDPDESSLGDYCEDALLARYARAFKTKSDAYRLYLKGGIVREGDRLVVAIGGDRIQGAQIEMPILPSVVRSLFPIGPMEVRWSPGVSNSHEVVFPSRQWIPENGVDRQGEPRRVAQDAFLDPQHSHVHAVMFSASGHFCGHDPKAMRFAYVVNPLAKRGRPHRWFKRCDAYQVVDGELARSRW